MKCGRLSSHEREAGVLIIFLALGIFALAGFAAVSYDWGKALDGQRKLQHAVDAAAIAAVRSVPVIPAGSSDEPVWNLAEHFASENGVDQSQISVECGAWVQPSPVGSATPPPAQFNAAVLATPCPTNDPNHSNCHSCISAGVNAVRVSGQENVPTFFGRILGVFSLTPAAEAVASLTNGNTSFCVKPFGVYLPLIDNIPLDGTGAFTVVEHQGAGNWGKLDIGKQMSSGTNFEDAMLENFCNRDVEVGSDIETGTGFGGSIEKVFDKMITAGKHLDMIITRTTQFPKGNKNIKLLEFIKVDLLSHSGSGKGWTADFLLKERGVIPLSGQGNSNNEPRLVR